MKVEPATSPLLALLAGFISELRAAGLPVSLTENLDAMEAIQHIPIEDRDAFKYALAATLVKNHAHWRAFETVFEVYFSLRGAEYDLVDGEWPDGMDLSDFLDGMDGQNRRQGGGGGEAMSAEQLAEMLFQALMRGDDAVMRAIARQAVQRYAGMEPGRPVGGTYYLYRTLRNLDLDGVLERLMGQARQDAPEQLTPLEERLERDEFEARVDQLRKEVEAEIRRRLVADRGVEAMAKTLRKPLPEDVDFMHASREEMLSPAPGHLPAHPQAGRAAGPQAAPRAKGAAGLPQHHAPLAVLRRGAGRAQVPLPPPGQARDHGGGRRERFGGSLRPVHPASGVRHQQPVLQGALVCVHRRPRRGDQLLRGSGRHRRGRPPGERRGRRGVGGRPLRLRPRLRGFLGEVRAGMSAPRPR